MIMPTLSRPMDYLTLKAKCLIKLCLSDRDFARELCADAAVYFDPLDPDEIVEVLRHSP